MAKPKQAITGADHSAETFIKRLKAHQSDTELKKIQRYFKSGEGEYGQGDQFLGIRMGQVFALAKEFIEMPPAEIAKVLDHPLHEVRAGALSIMDKQGRDKKTPESRRKELFDLYFKKMDRINNWDLVDLGAPFVVGRYLLDKPRKILYKLARSKNMWGRRTAILGSYYFLREGEVDDTFKICEILLNDPEDIIHKPVGAGLRWAGDHDEKRLIAFLDQYAATMPRVMLRFALEHFDEKQRKHYLGLKQAKV
jgi:DNA alkylation repair enzyme